MKKIITILTLNFIILNVYAQTKEPILRLNSQMHTAFINRISIDAVGKYILTASNDKTAKLWSAASGDLLKTLRTPIGHGKEGMLYASALSPNGKIAAVAGWTKNDDIYLFNTSTGEIQQRLTGLGNVISDLEFSPKGDYLAAALGGTKGVVIYKTNLQGLEDLEGLSIEKHKTLTGYGNSSLNITFDYSNRLATVCWDGKIRLYDKYFNLTEETNGAGTQPFSIAFSPDGSKLAVGYEDAPDIDIFSGKNLKLLYKAELDGMNENGGLDILSFSADGKYLYGGGGYSKYIDGNWWFHIRRWTNAGQGSYRDYQACDNSVMDIKTSASGDIFFAGAQPDFGRMNKYGDKRFYKAGEINSFTNSQFKYFKTNYSADKIAFTPLGKEAMLFSVADRKLSNFENQSNLESYTDNKSGISVSNWKNTYSPKINGTKVSFLRQYERCSSTDISSNGNKIILGTGWNIYCADATGNKLWKAPVQGTAWAVNISGNGKLLTAALHNGVINWYNMSDGELLLTLYAHPDNNRWVLFTPSGYYDASSGAEGLFGWHLNNGADNASYFFPASKFRNKYYRPDVIDNILQTIDIDEAVRIANISSNRKQNTTEILNMLPPVVSIIKPYHHQEFTKQNITIEYTALSPSGESITNVKFLIDGRPYETQRGFKPVGTSNNSTKTITIPKQDVMLQVLAQNRHGWSEPAKVHIKWNGQTVKQSDLLKPTLYVLAIGVSDYQNDAYDLNYAAQDARDFSSVMQAQKGGLYKDVVIKTLTDSEATKNDILDGLDWIQKECTSRDLAMIFIAGHGINDNIGSFYYLPYEADVERLRRTGLIFSEFKYTTSAVAGKIILFVDACHSGNVMGGRRGVPDVNSLVNELSDAESGAVVFTSSTVKQFSLEDAKWSNGAFTEALIEGMNGKADLFDKGKITVKTLDAYISERVKELTGGKQSPTMVIPQSIRDFPIGVVKK